MAGRGNKMVPSSAEIEGWGQGKGGFFVVLRGEREKEERVESFPPISES